MRIPSVTLAMFLCLAAFPAFAEYQVEVVVFANAAADSDGEQWLDDPGIPDTAGFAVLNGVPQDGAVSWPALPAASKRLGGVLSALRRSGRYRPLFHAAWVNPAGSGIRGVYIVSPEPGSESGTPTLVLGTVRLRVGRFLHADVDVAYAPPELAAAEVTSVRLTDSRKIRLNEVHYFDHPLFGVLLQVSRMDGGSGDDTDATDVSREADGDPGDEASPGVAPARP